ncbi:hypothetical protein [Streptomyces sp. NPDC001292]|uniref:hypothetical protein n=1 Tax=Streptomyces sp. NPDC001292 TaxID=3364558 RepID=UPI0036A4C338
MTSYENTDNGARVTVASGENHEAGMMIAADGLHSPARRMRPTALTPDQEPPMFTPIPLSSADAEAPLTVVEGSAV